MCSLIPPFEIQKTDANIEIYDAFSKKMKYAFPGTVYCLMLISKK